MDKYFLAIMGLIIFSILVILYIRISGKSFSGKINPQNPEKDNLNNLNRNPQVGNSDSLEYDSFLKASDPLLHLKHLKPSDFTLLE